MVDDTPSENVVKMRVRYRNGAHTAQSSCLGIAELVNHGILPKIDLVVVGFIEYRFGV